ncbi:MAG: heparinase II/III family protein [bacterium]|nr:heparinase II/III family protein [bacterium]
MESLTEAKDSLELPRMTTTDYPNVSVFQEKGWAEMHSDLENPDQDTFLLFKSSPHGNVTSPHVDQNAFAILQGGKALAVPYGYDGPFYGMPEHAPWAGSTKANNCVLVNGEGQEGKDRGKIVRIEDLYGRSYVVGDAAPAYMGKLKRFERHVLFLRPGLFLLLDDLEAPAPSSFQWMLHALEEMELDEGRVVSRREGATLDVRLACSTGLSLSQTDRLSSEKEMQNYWHVTAETIEKRKAVRIGAAMGVWGPEEVFEMTMLEHPGWFGARAEGDFGVVEGWVQLEPGAKGPKGYPAPVPDGRAVICGVTVDGHRAV